MKELMESSSAENEDLENIDLLAKLQSNLGTKYLSLHEWDKAESFYKSSMALLELSIKKTKTPSRVNNFCITTYNLYLVYSYTKMIIKAHECCSKSIDMIKQSYSDDERTEQLQITLGDSYNNLAMCYTWQNNYNLAIEYFNLAIQLQEKFPGSRMYPCPLATYNANLACSYILSEDLNSGFSVNRKAKDALRNKIFQGENIDLSTSTLIYDNFLKIFAKNTLEHELFQFALDVLKGNKNATHQNFLQLHLSVLQSISWQKTLDSQVEILDFMLIARNLFKNELLPDSPFKTYLQNPENFKSFENKIADAQKTEINLQNIIGSSPTAVLGVVKEIAVLTAQNKSLQQQLDELKKLVLNSSMSAASSSSNVSYATTVSLFAATKNESKEEDRSVVSCQQQSMP